MSPFEFQPPKEQPSVEFKKVYKKILNTSVSPENIETFFDTTLNELVVLIEKSVVEYKRSNKDTPLEKAELEDKALQAMNIPDVTETLQAVSEREQAMIQLRHLIASQTETKQAVIVPPREGANGILPGSGAGVEQKKLIPRLLTLLYILENDLGYSLSQEEETSIHITEGATTDEMMRQHPYYRVLIESLNRVIYLCEEEGNASYIFDTEVLAVPLEQLDVRNKNAFNDLIKVNPEVGRRLIQSPLWRKKMVGYLTEEFSVEVNGKDAETQPITSLPQSDFVPRVEVSRKKEGWESASSLCLLKIIHSDLNTIKPFTEQFRTEHPEWFEIQNAKNGKPSEYYHPDLIQKIIDRFASIPQKKDEWESANGLKDTVHSSAITIRSFVEQFRTEHPEWFEKQMTQGKETEHYHPDLVKKIQEYFASVPQKKEGWESAQSLGRKIHFDSNTIKPFAEQFRAEHPEWFEIQKTGTQGAEHYHPDLVEKIKKDFSRILQEKGGWEGANGLSRIIHSSVVLIKSYAEQFRAEHPEWFEIQKATRGREFEHYHPDLVRKITERFPSVPQKKDGWRSANSLSNEMHSKHYTVKKFAEQFRTEHPEWFEIQKFGRSTQSESYHPDLVRKIKEHSPLKVDK